MLDTQPRFTLPVLRGLASIPDLRIHILALRRWSELRCSRWHMRYHVFREGGTADEYLDRILAIIRQEQIDVVVPVYEDAVRFVSAHREALEHGCRCALTPPVDMMDRLADKWQTACLLGSFGIPLPETKLLSDTDALDPAVLPPFPVLLKPLAGQGGRGVVKVDSFEELCLIRDRGELRPGRQVIQRFVAGSDIDCSVLCRDGEILAHTIQSAVVRHPVPFAPAVGIRFGGDEGVFRIARTTMRQLHWNGVAHLDMRRDAATEEILLLEINPRFWMSVLGSVHAGVNFPYLACLAAMGERFTPPEARPGPFVWQVQTAVRLLLTGGLMHGHNGLSPGRTVLSYAMRDPLPELYAVTRMLVKR